MTLVIPPLISIPFGNGAGGGYITEPIPVASQIGITPGAASFTDGFPPLTMTELSAGGIPPFGQDVNGILYMLSAHAAWISAGAPYKYSSAQATAIGGYPVGALLSRSDGTGYWLNETAGNTSDPDAGGAGWVPAFNYGAAAVTLSSGTVALTADQYARPFIVLSGALSGNVNVTFPNTLQQWLVVNNTTGAHTVTATNGGATVVIPQTGYSGATNIFGDGAGNLYSNAISTAGLAPINSPALTGTPTTPTATPVGSSTSQIANTAFVQAAITARIAGLAPLASPTFTGTPTAPTPSPGDNSVKLATTAFVQAAGAAYVPSAAMKNGLVTGVAGGGTYSVTFPTPFATECDDVHFTAGNLSVGNSYVPCFLIAMTRFGFTFGTQGGSGSPNVWWRAFGK